MTDETANPANSTNNNPIPTDPPPPIEMPSPINANTAIPPFEKQQPLPPELENPFPGQPTERPSHAKIIIFAIFLFLTIAASGGSLALAYNNYKILPVPKSAQHLIDNIIMVTPLPKTPRLILSKTEVVMAEIKTAQLETEFKFETNSQNFPIKNGKVTIKGPLDFKTQQTPRSEFDISGEVAMEGIQLTAAASIKQIDDTLYFKLTEVPASSLLKLDSLKNQWFFTKSESKTPEAQNQEKIAKIQARFSQFTADAKAWTTIQETQGNSYKLKVKPPKEEIAKLIFDLINIIEPKDQTAVASSLDMKKIQEFADKLQDTEVNLTINKSDGLVTESVVTIPIKVSVPSELMQTTDVNLSPQSPLSINITIDTKLSNFNQSVIIDIPQGAKDIKDYTGELQKSLPQNLTSPLPQESTPESQQPSALPLSSQSQDNQTDQQDDSTFHNLLDDSQVQGTKISFWNLLFRGLTVK